MRQEPAVELRPRRLWLVLTGLAGIGVVTHALWSGGALAWLGVPLGATFIAGSGYWLTRGKSRISLSGTGIEWGFEWSRRTVDWTQVESIHERRGGGGLLTRRLLRVLAIRTRGDVRGASLTRRLYRADFVINISALEQSADAVIALVERFSGHKVERIR